MLRKMFLYGSIVFFSFALFALIAGLLIYNSQNLDASKLGTPDTGLVIYCDNNTVISQTQYNKTNLDELPEYIKWAFICVEDKDFYNHNGVSVNRIAKASFKNASAKEIKEGASTITQQLIKNTHLSHDKTFQRKMREASLAHKLEKKYSKDEILSMYLDVVYFGNGVNGFDAAARFYYDKSPSKLTITEVAGLAGMLRSPARYNPITNSQAFTDRTNYVLKMMHDQGKITTEEYQIARVEEPQLHMKHNRQSASYIAATTSQAERILGINTFEMARLGYKIHTYHIPETQTIIDNTIIESEYRIINKSGKTSDNLSIVANPDGGIIALNTNNRLMPTARRDFASSLKPLVVFAPAIETKTVTPETIISDTPYVAGDFNPSNHDGTYRGDVTVRESLAHSYNIPSVKVLEYTGLGNCISIAKRLGLPLGDENLNLALGVTSNGITAFQLLGGYCALANSGYKTETSLIKRISDNEGNTLWEHSKPACRVLETDTTLAVTDMLCSAVQEGTARKMSSLSFDIAAKTGTTQRCNASTNTDAINISYTPNHVLLVWNGNADMNPRNDLPSGTTGGGVTSYIARDIMRAITTSKTEFPPAPVFEEFSPINQSSILKLSGHVNKNGQPELSFNAEPNKSYEIYRTINNEKSLLAVTQTDVFIDVNAPSGRVIEYNISDDSNTSNTIKLYVANQASKPLSQQKHGKSTHWFF